MTRRSSSDHKKGTPPKLGEAFGSRWGDDSLTWHTLPGAGVVQFNLNKLTLSDFRMMRDHYQVNASLAVLSFMMHQLDWRIECTSDKVRRHVESNMEAMWTRIVRALSQAFWAGYSPNVLQWENDIQGRSIVLTKIKDLPPESCQVNWKKVDGWAPPGHIPPQIKVYDGIKQHGAGWPIPTENSLWYPLLMENGDHYGRKLLRPAFTPWFFSILIHLYANRYFERFGEPVPVGRAPFDEKINIDGQAVSGNELMLTVLKSIRNRSAVVLPNTRSIESNETQSHFDFTLEYLESQMRGADFERYQTRLDEEISLALFTPLLMLRTADVGSYSLGNTHTDVYRQMLNAIAGDWAEYINKYLISRMVDFNFGVNAPRASIQFRKLASDKFDLLKVLLQQLIADGKIKPNVQELGEIAGLSFTEVQELTEKEDEPQPAKDTPVDDTASDVTNSAQATASAIFARVESQIRKARKDGSTGQLSISLGYRRQFETSLALAGVDRHDASEAHNFLASWASELTSVPFDSTDALLTTLRSGIDSKVKELVDAAAA